MSTYYLGHAKNGDAVKRKSNRADFTHAAVAADPAKRTRLPSFATSAVGAVRNFGTYQPCEVVTVEIVDAATFKAAGQGVGKGRR